MKWWKSTQISSQNWTEPVVDKDEEEHMADLNDNSIEELKEQKDYFCFMNLKEFNFLEMVPEGWLTIDSLQVKLFLVIRLGNIVEFEVFLNFAGS